MINLNIENLEIANREPGEVAVKCQLNITFAITPDRLAEMREEINQESAANPGVMFEVLTQEREEWKCSGCGTKVTAPFGDKPKDGCLCFAAGADWEKVQ